MLNSRFTINTLIILAICVAGLSNMAHAAPKKDLWPRWEVTDAVSTKTIDHSAWTKFLKEYVITNRDGINLVKYSRVKQRDKDRLNDYIWRLSQVKVGQYNRNVQLAFWINLYNAVTIKTVLDHYPVKSIRDINISPGFFEAGPWAANLLKVDGSALSLNDIEHRIIRPIWNDARTHYALNCASIGCPNLQKTAYTGANVNNMLNAAARQYINSLRGVNIINGKLVTSKIYDWYKADFGNSDIDVIKHLMDYAKPQLKQALAKFKKISDTEYNWHLNEARKVKKSKHKQT